MGWYRARPGRAYLAGAPMLVAHRGGARLAPENTLAAFVPAVEEWGADMLETDVRLTADGHVVAIHDATVDRTTNGTGRVADLTLAELRGLDAGHHFLDGEGRPSFRARGVRVPTLHEVLDACPGVWINVEAKEAQVAGPLVELLRRRGDEHRVLVAAEHERCRRDARGYPGPWGASRADCVRFWLATVLPLGGLFTPDADVLQVPEIWKGHRLVTPRFVSEAHRRNLPVHVWTVDDPGDMRRLLDLGVDAIQSDRPDLLAAVLTEVANRPPPPAWRRAASTEPGDGPNDGGRPGAPREGPR